MFGTIGHARLKSGKLGDLDALGEEWSRDIRPSIPGDVVQYIGHAAGSPDDLVFVALMQDEATYRQLADNLAQDAWYRRFVALIDGDVR